MAHNLQPRETTPPDNAGATYDLLLVVCIRDDEPIQQLAANYRYYESNKPLNVVFGFDPTKKMSIANRMKTAKVMIDDCEPDKELSVFCRIEKGMEPSRIQEVKDKLNKRFKGLSFGQRKAMKMTLIKSFGEKFMCAWTYPEMDPIKGKRMYYPWVGAGTRRKGVSSLPQTGGELEDSDEEATPVRIGRKGKEMPISSSASEAGNSPNQSAVSPIAQGHLVTNPLFSSSPAKGKATKGMPLKGKTPAKSGPRTKKGLAKKRKASGLETDSSDSSVTLMEELDSTLTELSGSKSNPKKSRSQSPAKDVEKRSQRASAKKAVAGIQSELGIVPASGKPKESTPDNCARTAGGVVQTICRSISPPAMTTPSAMDAPPSEPPLAVVAPPQAFANEPQLVPVAPPGAIPPVVAEVVSEFPAGEPVTNAFLISDDQMEVRFNQYLEEYLRRRHGGEVDLAAQIRTTVQDVMSQYVMPTMRNDMREIVREEVRRIMDEQEAGNKQPIGILKKIQKSTENIQDLIADFSVEQARIRNEIKENRDHAAEKASRAVGILGRLLPFDFMGEGCDVFLASHYVQSKVVAMMKADLDSPKYNVNTRIAFAVTDCFFSRLAMAHLIWKQPKSVKKQQYFKREIPEALPKIIKSDVIPYLRKKMDLGKEAPMEDMSKIRLRIAQRFTNSRTRQLEVAHEKTNDSDCMIDVMHNTDNEYYFHNQHAIPAHLEPENRVAYCDRMRLRSEFNLSIDESQDEEDKEYPPEEEVFYSLMARRSKHVFSVYDVIKTIVAAAAVEGEDISKLTWDKISFVPNLEEIYKKVVADYMQDIDGLLRQFPPYEGSWSMPIKVHTESDEEELANLTKTPTGSPSMADVSRDDGQEPSDGNDDDDEVIQSSQAPPPDPNTTFGVQSSSAMADLITPEAIAAQRQFDEMAERAKRK